MMSTTPRPNNSVRHSTCHPLAMNVTSRRVPAMLRQTHRMNAVITHAQPTMVMMETIPSTYQPT